MNYKKSLSILLTGSILMSNVPVNASVLKTSNVEAILSDVEVLSGGAVDVAGKFDFGSALVNLQPGKYDIPVKLKNASNIANDSMAASCLLGAVMTVNEDGSADFSIDIGPVQVFNVVAYSSEWKIYQGDSVDSELLEAEESLDSEGRVNNIKFRLPNNSFDGVYVSMNSGHAISNAYIAIDYANAEEAVEQRDKFDFGSALVNLQPGKYDIPVEMKKANDITVDSMGKECLLGAVMTVNEDGSSDLSFDLGPVTAYGVTAYSKEWKIYQGEDVNSSSILPEESFDSEGRLNNIKFRLPNNSFDGVYVNVAADAHKGFDAYIKLDYARATAVEEEAGFEFGSKKVILEEGVYEIPVALKNASNINNDSMAGSALNGARITVDENGKAKMNIDLVAVSVMGITTWAYDWKIYQGEDTSSELVAAKETKNEDGNVIEIEFEIPNNSFDGYFVSMFVPAMGYAPDAYLVLDYENVTKIEETTSESTTEVTTEATTSESTTEVTTEETTSESTTEVTTEATTSESTTEVTTEAITEETTSESTTEITTETTTSRPVSSGGSSGAGGSLKVNKATTTTTEATTEETTEEAKEENNSVSKVKEVLVTIGSKKIMIDGESIEIDATPYIQSASSSTMVPLRFVAVALSGDIENAQSSEFISWDSVEKKATIYFNDSVIEFVAGSNVVRVDGIESKMENNVVAEIINGRMFVPFRALGNALGVDVNWDEVKKVASYKNK